MVCGEQADRAVLGRRALGREQLTHELVVRHAVAHAPPYELVEFRPPCRVNPAPEVVSYPEHFAEPHGPAIGEAVAGDQPAHEPLPTRVGGLREVEIVFGDGGDSADEVDRGTP